MKKISITVDGTGSVSPGIGSAGFYGEHLVTELEITLSDTFSENCEYYKMNIDGYVSGRLTPADGKINYTLPQSVLRPPAINCQVIGYKIVDDVPVMVVRSAPFALTVEVSPGGDSPEIIADALEPLETALAECGNTVAASKKLLEDISGAQSTVREELKSLKDQTVSCASTAVDCVNKTMADAAAAAKSASEAAASAASISLDNYYKKSETYSKEQAYSKTEADNQFAARSSPNSIVESSVACAAALWIAADDTGASSFAELNDTKSANQIYLWSSKKVDTEIKNQNKLLCNALKGSKSGGAVRIEDVSPVNEELKIKLTSDTVTDFSNETVLKYGKNLWRPDYFKTSHTVNGVTVQYLADEDCYLLNGTATTFGEVRDDSFYVYGMKNKAVTISYTYISGTADKGYIYIAKADKSDDYRINFLDCALKAENAANTAVCDKQCVKSLWFYWTAGAVFTNYKIKVQVEIGSAATEYEPYKAPLTFASAADGTVEEIMLDSGVSALIPGSSGIVLNCEYDRDINKAFAELQQAIISLGGNI